MSHRGIIDALSNSAEPSIRWKTRVRVLGEDRSSKVVQRLEREVAKSARVRALLAESAKLGRADTSRRVYYKWQGLHWVLASLADLGFPRRNPELVPVRNRVLDLWLRPSFYREFVANTLAAGYGRQGVPLMNGRYRRCGSQQGNALLSAIELGLEDERCERLAERLMHWQWPDGGWNCDRHPDAHVSSFNETLLPMMGLAAFSRLRRSSVTAEAARAASEVFLRRRLFRRVSDGEVIAKDFVVLHYPRYWHYDYLGGLRGLACAGRMNDPRCEVALDLLESARLPDGGWPAQAKYYSGPKSQLTPNADYVDWGGTSSRRMNEWVTVEALAVLGAAGRLRV